MEEGKRRHGVMMTRMTLFYHHAREEEVEKTETGSYNSRFTMGLNG